MKNCGISILFIWILLLADLQMALESKSPILYEIKNVIKMLNPFLNVRFSGRLNFPSVIRNAIYIISHTSKTYFLVFFSENGLASNIQEICSWPKNTCIYIFLIAFEDFFFFFRNSKKLSRIILTSQNKCYISEKNM